MRVLRGAYDGWTIDDLDALPPDGLRRELLDGVLVAMGPQPAGHRRLAVGLRRALSASCPPEYAVSTAGIRDGHRRAFAPDLVVAAADADPDRLRPDQVVLAVEIVSAASLTIDRIRKPALYAQAGIGGYWRIEPTEGYRVHAYNLDKAGVYTEAGEFDTVVRAERPWPIELDLAAVKPE
jgi:Uma2 family endonuclease